MVQSFSNQVLILLKKIWRRNPNFAGPSTETCARHDGHPQSPFTLYLSLVYTVNYFYLFPVLRNLRPNEKFSL